MAGQLNTLVPIDPYSFSPDPFGAGPNPSIQPLTTISANPITLPSSSFNLVGVDRVDTIQGQMVSVQIVVNHDEKEMLGTSAAGFQEIMKKRLCEALIQEMIKSKVIEFTSQMDPVELVTTYRARIYVTPDTQVRLLRKNQSL